MLYPRAPWRQVSVRTLAAIIAMLTLECIRASSSQAQLLRVTSPVNLRRSASTDSAPIRLVPKDSVLVVADHETENGFYAVESLSGETGWVWARNVKRVTAGESAARAPASRALLAATEARACRADGNAVLGSRDDSTDALKIRTNIVRQSDIDAGVTLHAMLARGADAGRFDQKRAATIEGYILLVKDGGPETVNCGGQRPYDTHMDVVASKGVTADGSAVIVEVTPQWRKVVAQSGGDWSTKTLKPELVGKRVRVTGWLLWDWRHQGVATNTGKAATKKERATVWEIHPITKIEVFEDGDWKVIK